jgi:ATP-dependent helicase/nuclease subunit B
LAILETLRTGDVEDATETLRRLLDDRFDLEAATEDYASAAEHAVEQRVTTSSTRFFPRSSSGGGQ